MVKAQAELGSLEALGSLGVRESAKGDGDSNPCQGADFSGVYWGLLGFTGGAHCVRLLGAELKLLTGVRGSARG